MKKEFLIIHMQTSNSFIFTNKMLADEIEL